MFGQDLGSKLLELSLSRARKRPEDQRADDRAARAEPPRLRVVAAESGTERRKAAPEDPPAATPSKEPAAPELPQPAGLDLSRFEKVGSDQYRSPGGVLLRIVLREGGKWDVADIDFDGEVRLEQLGDGRVRVKIGDLRIEYSGKFERRLRLT
jgi:hypothetical protein